MVRTPASVGTETTASTRSGAGDGPTTGWLARTVLVGLATGAVAYLVVRRWRSDAIEAPIDDVSDVVDAIVPGEGAKIPIDGVSEDDAEDEDAEDEGTDAAPPDEGDEAKVPDEKGEAGDQDQGEEAESPDQDEEGTDAVGGDDALGAAPSSEEIAESVEADIQAEPAQPGSMTIDEGVADELVDEEELESGEETDTERDDRGGGDGEHDGEEDSESEAQDETARDDQDERDR